MTTTTSTPSDVIVLGRDEIGIVAESDGMRYYLTDCCLASAKGSGGCTVCRSCYEEIDDALGGIPDEVTKYIDGSWQFVAKPLELVEVFGDGLPYDVFVVSTHAAPRRHADG